MVVNKDNWLDDDDDDDNDILTSSNRVIMAPQLPNNLPAFYRTSMLITGFTRTHY